MLGVRPNMVDFEWSGAPGSRVSGPLQMFVDNQGTLKLCARLQCVPEPADGFSVLPGLHYIVISNPFPPNNPAKVSLRTPDGEPVWDGEAVSDEQGQINLPDVAPTAPTSSPFAWAGCFPTRRAG